MPRHLHAQQIQQHTDDRGVVNGVLDDERDLAAHGALHRNRNAVPFTKRVQADWVRNAALADVLELETQAIDLFDGRKRVELDAGTSQP